MEIVTRELETNRMRRNMVHQFLIDEDYNVPDSRWDVKKIIMAEGVLKVEEMKPSEHQLSLRGNLEFQILYETEHLEPRYGCLEGKVPFMEVVYIEEKNFDAFDVNVESIELKVNMIHSRKLRLRAVADLSIDLTKRESMEIPIDVVGEEHIFKKKEEKELLTLHTAKKDVVRIKAEMTLPGTKESVGTLLWTDISNRKLETKLLQNEMMVSGEVFLFLFYESPEGKIDWVEQSVTYTGRVECNGADETMFHHVEPKLEGARVEIRMDEDGEPRIISVEGALNCKVAVYKEEKVDVLQDLYSLQKNCTFDEEEMICEQLLLQNNSKCKIMERLNLPELQNDILQVCHCKGQIYVEEMKVQEDGIRISGILYMSFLYVKASDEAPFDVWSGMIPFTHLLETGSTEEQILYRINTMLEQLSISLQGGNEIEVKAVLVFCGFIRKEVKVRKIANIQMNSVSKEEIEQRPSILGYVVKNGDELWDLAKKYYTSVESIKTVNEITGDKVKVGDRLLIFKENMSIL